MLSGRFAKYVHDKMARNAKMETFARIAKVTVVHTDGGYTVELPGGQTLNQLPSTSNTKHYVDEWVTLEFMGGDWSLIGPSNEKGGF